MTIPRIIHQLARTAEIPPHLQGCQASWRRLNPEFEYHLWTEQTLEAWVAEHTPEFLSLFRAYPRSICRADLGRYLLLDRIGGVYADLDCQCLQPITPLLKGRQLLIAHEPEAHHDQIAVQDHAWRQIVCPSFIASEPGHSLWMDVLQALCRFEPAMVLSNNDVLHATGPFLLSSVFAANPRHERHQIASELVYPFSKSDCWQGLSFDPAFWSERTRHAFVAHYWDASWFRPSWGWHSGVPSQAPVHVHEPPWPVSLPGVVGRNTGQGDAPPLISCLMVTRGRAQQALLAIDCFLAQTYEASELILVDDDPHSQLAAEIAAMGSSRIRHVRLPDRGQSLGALRNIALDHALGDYICQWDDDDLHDPVRLEVQWQTLHASGAQASLLARWMIWWPHQRRLAVSRYRDWEGSLLCERSLMPRYPDWRRGEDSDVVSLLMQTVRVARIDMPRLYVYICHGANTFESDHFDSHWQQATASWQQAECERLEQELDRRLPLLRYRQGLAATARTSAASAPPPTPVRVASADPRVLILTPVRDGEPFLDRYVTLLEQLDFDASSLSLGLLEGDSVDGSFEALQRLRPRLDRRCRRVALHRHQLHPPRVGGERWQRALQRDRRERLAQSRNRLLMAALEDEDWVLWLDVDLSDYPANLLRQLLAAGRDIVTANCLGPGGEPFDLNGYRLRRDSAASGRNDQPPDPLGEHLIDGLLQPPPGIGRLYIDQFRDQPLLEVDAVGGTALLVRADLHRHGLNFPTYPFENLIETEAFSRVARAQGVRSWALPQLVIRHT